MKLPAIFTAFITLNVYPGAASYRTVLKMIIPTASLVMPSPTTTLKSLGCCSYLITEIAATGSDEHIRLHINKIS